MKIRIPIVLLQLRITNLLDDIHNDWREEPHIPDFSRMSDRPFRDGKYSIVFSGDYSAFVLASEYILTHPEVEESTLLLSSAWDLDGLARPALAEWRRRWWAPRVVPEELVQAVELTNESLPVWRERKRRKEALPPRVVLFSQDLRHALERMGWRKVSEHAGVQRMEGTRDEPGVYIPSDALESTASSQDLVVGWWSSHREVVDWTSTDDLKTQQQQLIDAWQAAGEPQIASLLQGFDPEARPDEAANRLEVAARLLAERT